MKFCKDCKYFEPNHLLDPACTKHAYDHQDVVTGKVTKRGIEVAQAERQPSDPSNMRTSPHIIKACAISASSP